jgi:integrase
MASIWRNPKSKYFTACFRDGSGKQRRITTKEINRRRALKIAEAFEKAAREQRTLTHTRRIIEQLHEEISQQKIERPSLRSFAQSWLDAKKPEVAPRTLVFYAAAIGKLIEFLEERADAPLNEITKRDLIAFRNSTSARTTARTANHYLKAARMLFRSAYRDTVLSENPAEFVEGVRERGETRRRQTFSLDELRSVLAHCDPEWRSMVLFGLYSGQRLSDLASLTWSNIDLQRGELRLQTHKTSKRLIIPLAPPLLQHLETLPSSDNPRQPLHPRAFAFLKKEGRTATISNQFTEILALAGLRPHQNKGHQSTGKGRDGAREQSPLSFHSLRRTATTLLHEAGVPAAVCQALIGHDSEAIHELYVTVGREALARAAAVLPAL